MMNVQNELVLMDPAVLIREVDRYLANKHIPLDCRLEVREAIAVQALRAVGRVTTYHGKHEKRTAFSTRAEGFGLRNWQQVIMRANASGLHPTLDDLVPGSMEGTETIYYGNDGNVYRG